MSEITLRNVKGSPLTYSELDDNFLYLSQSYLLADATASLSVRSASFAQTASLAPGYLPILGGTISGSLTVLGTASISYLNVTFESASVIYSSGSNQFGDASNDTQVLYGTVIISGSQQITGSVNAPNITGSLFGTASQAISASYASASQTSISSSVAVSASYALTASFLSGSSTTSSYSLTASVAISSVSASRAENAVSSSYPFAVTGSSLYAQLPSAGVPGGISNAIWIGERAGSGSSTTNTGNSIFIGNAAGASNRSPFSTNDNIGIGQDTLRAATTSSENVAIGKSAGIQARGYSSAVMIGTNAGIQAKVGANGISIGVFAGGYIESSSQTVFIGDSAGANTIRGAYNIGIGSSAGSNTNNASHSIFIGYQAGRAVSANQTVGANNIILGTNVTLDAGRKDSINIGGLIFGSSSYSRESSDPFSGSANGRIGINQPLPEYSLDVSGSGRFTNGITGSLFGTASWAQNIVNAVSSSYPITVTGSTLRSVSPEGGNRGSTTNGIYLGNGAGVSASNASNSNFLGVNAGYEATNANNSNFLGEGAGESATNAIASNFLGYYAGRNARDAAQSNFLGSGAGYSASNADNSNFLGLSAGSGATNANQSNFLGYAAGSDAINANNSNFIGNYAGAYAISASYSTLIGYQVGYNSVGGGAFGIKSNNIIIGTNITLADGRKDSINFGGLIFGTGSYSTIAGNPFSGSANGRIGINQPLPIFSLDVSGSGRYTNGLTVTGSLKMSTTTGTPSNTATASGYYQAELNGSTVYIPYYT